MITLTADAENITVASDSFTHDDDFLMIAFLPRSMYTHNTRTLCVECC